MALSHKGLQLLHPVLPAAGYVDEPVSRVLKEDGDRVRLESGDDLLIEE